MRRRPGAGGAARWVCGIALGVLLVSLGAGGWARAQSRRAPTPPPPPLRPIVVALLSEDEARRWSALSAMRTDRETAREALVEALDREEAVPGRWRLMNRLVEFGTGEDVPLLLKLRESSDSAWERRIAEGAARALYEPAGTTERLESIVQDFSFIQTGPPAIVSDPSEGKWMLSGWSLGDYHREGVPLAVIKRLRHLRGRPYDSERGLAQALEKQLGPRDWQEHGERVMASAETVPRRARLEGLARVSLFNPLSRPLLLWVSLDAWFGGFPEPPGRAWVYLPAGANRILDVPVTAQGSLERPQLRMDLRLAEVDGLVLPGFHKLYLPLQR